MQSFVRHRVLFLWIFLSVSFVFSQSTPPPDPIRISNQTIKIDGTQYYVHIIRLGQTAYSISKAYNVPVEQLRYKHALTQLALNDTLFVPVSKVSIFDIPFGEHTVQLGETLFGISRYYLLKEKDITEINPGLTAENLQAGATIRIPISTGNKKFLKEVSRKETISPSFPPPVLAPSPQNQNMAKKHLNVALILPLRLDKLQTLSFSKFDIDTKKQMQYPSFEYLQFYEGARIALDKLEKQGYRVSLYVYDVNESDPASMQALLKKKEMKEMDILVPLVLFRPFEVIAEYAKNENIAIVNPMSNRSSMTIGNPTIYKIMCSNKGKASTILRYISSSYVSPHVVLLHSNAKTEKNLLEHYKSLLGKQKKVLWTEVLYTQPSALLNHLKPDKDNIIITLVDKGTAKENEAFASGLTSRLSLYKSNVLTLFVPSEWIDYTTIDFGSLQQLNVHFEQSCSGDYSNKNFVSFVYEFRNHFKTEPSKVYASLGYDIMLYFVRAISQSGSGFLQETNPSVGEQDMINPFSFSRSSEQNGFENQRTVIYRLLNHRIIPVGQ